MFDLVSPAYAQAEQLSRATQVAGNAADTLITQGGIYGSIAVIVGLAVVAIIIALGFVIRALWRTIAERDRLIATLQDKRAEDGKTSAKLLTEVATTGSMNIAANTTAQVELTHRMQKMAELVIPMADKQDRMLDGLDRNADKIDALARTVGSGCRA